LGYATATDNCTATGNIVITHSDVTNACANGGYTISRTWKAEDECGNFSECTQTITVTTKKSNNCFSAELTGKVVNGTSTTYTFKACAGNCQSALSYIAFIINSGNVTNPLNGSYYNNGKYKVSVPVSKTQKGIKFDVATGEGIKKNSCDEFTFTITGTQPSSIKVQFKAGTKTYDINMSTSSDCVCQTISNSNVIVQSSSLVKEDQNEITKLSVSAYPNPYTNSVRFTVANPKAGQGNLEVFNMLGQRVKTVYQGFIPAGTQTYQMNISGMQTGNLIYRLRVGTTQVTGKLLHAKQ
jgi:hypothetical protein